MIYGDIYPLTPWTRDHAEWIAWQFDRPESGEGVVQVFRRDASFYESAQFKLRGLEADACYHVSRVGEKDKPRDFTGAELMDPGLLVDIPTQPGAAILRYQMQIGSKSGKGVDGK